MAALKAQNQSTLTIANLERKILTEFLMIYKENSCLWDPKHPHYATRKIRDEAYGLMLEQYREIQPDITMIEMKKKLDHMRISYRREHKKVLLAQMEGQEHHPVLWFYKLMSFLNDVADFSNIKRKAVEMRSGQEENNVDDSIDEAEDFPCLAKVLKSSPTHSPENRVLYIPEYYDNEESPEENEEQDMIRLDSEDQSVVDAPQTNNSKKLDALTESVATTIGYQLHSLSKVQRTIAEKLISDVIFHGRCGRLKFDTHVALRRSRSHDHDDNYDH